jgi:HSP20 family molecular chaperone IbpA
MSILERVPVPYARKTTFTDTIRNVYEHVRGKAFEYYLERGGLDGYDLEDWLRAERTLILKPDVTLRRFGEDIVIEVAMPDVDLEEIHLEVSPEGMLVTTTPDEDGRQVLRTVQFAEPIDVDSIEAEYTTGSLRLTVPVADTSNRLSRSHVG